MGLASIGILAIGLNPASGQDASGQFDNGTAKATAVVAKVAPGVGSLELGITGGVAVSEVRNTLAQSQAETLDLGLVGSVLTAEQCDGSDAILPADQLPNPTRVDSRDGDASLHEGEVDLPGLITAGDRLAEATVDPAARAVSTVLGAIGPLLNLHGGMAEASTRVIPGEGREAQANVSVDLDIGGLIELRTLRWEALHRTGADPAAEATFDVGTAALLGVPIPLDSLYALEDVLNDVLELSGVTISFPKVERFTEPADLIRITPLTIVVKDSPLGSQVLGPVIGLGRAEREQLFDELSAAYCRVAGGLLLADVGLSVVQGTGFLAVEIGGAEALSGELEVENPFGEAEALPQQDESVEVAAPAPAVAAPPAARSAVAPSSGPTEPAASVGPLEERCESAHPLRQTTCSRGALLAVGLAGLLATACMGALDWRHQRRLSATAAGNVA